MVSILEDLPTGGFEAVLAEHDVVFVDFWAGWCAPCRSFSPKFARAAREVHRRAPEGSVAFVKVDTEAHKSLAKRYAVQSLPTLLCLRKTRGWLGGVKIVEAGRHSGDMAANALSRWIAARSG